MSSLEYESRQPSPFTGLPDPRFFYGNLSNLEVLAALRFGIEARRGLILITGEAGTGKSAVLHELARELNPKATCILISDPHVGFTELLRLILRNLEVEAEGNHESELIRCCKTALRSRIETNRIVSLAFDDAQHLSDEVIESLTKHFLGKGFDPDNNLLQIVLAGRPELRKRLFTPPLRALDTQVEIECRLQPLDVGEVGLYIKHRLCAADLPAEIFNHDAIERIAVYSDGRPGPINAICDRALQLTDRAIPSKITSDVIAGAARDLDLGKPGRTGNSKKPIDEASGRQATTVVAGTFPMFTAVKEGKRSFSPAEGNRRTISVLLIVILLAVSAAWLRGGPALSYVKELRIKLDELAGSKRQIPAQEKIEADTAPPAATQGLPSAPRPNADVPLPQSDKPVTNDLPLAKTEKSVELPASVPLDQPSAANLESLLARANQDRHESSPKEQRRDPAKQISKAIENRAILGVYVSVIDGIAYLDGRVATPEQRNAAERAARGVPDVRGIRNRIAIE
ncbi:MAG: AAA family ATPase [Candidatus Binatia bacterium]